MRHSRRMMTPNKHKKGHSIKRDRLWCEGRSSCLSCRVNVYLPLVRFINSNQSMCSEKDPNTHAKGSINPRKQGTSTSSMYMSQSHTCSTTPILCSSSNVRGSDWRRVGVKEGDKLNWQSRYYLEQVTMHLKKATHLIRTCGYSIINS